MLNRSFKYDLTIGMIVKNEIKYLRRCLETLQPLRDAISCQLVITDTGSTDGTQEVAKEFADVYLEFDWCNDFSKARNTGVEVAEGRWFFYVDADNEFDDSLLDVARFLKKSGVDQEFDAASIIIRNYADTTKKRYHDITRTWILNFSYSKRFFQNAIHETIPVNQNKIQALSTVMHHWGYMTEVIQGKNDRNLPILRKMFQENPSDLKNRVQLAKELGDPEEKRAFLQESLEFMKPLGKKSDDAKMWIMILSHQYQQFALHLQDYPLAERLIKEWETYLSGSIFEINFYGFCMEVYLQQGEERESVLFETFPRYQSLFLKQRKQSDARFKLFYNFDYATDLHYYQVEFRTIHRAIETGETEKASQWLKGSKAYEYQLSNGVHKYIFDVVHCCFLLKEYEFLAALFSFAAEKSTENEQTLLIQELEKRYHALSSTEKNEFLSVFSRRCTHWYVGLMKFRFYGNNLSLCPEVVVDLLKEVRCLPQFPHSELLSPLLYSMLLTGEDPLSYVEQLTHEQLERGETYLLEHQLDFDRVLLSRLKQPSQALTLGQKQILGHLSVSLSLRMVTSSQETSSVFWTGVSLLVLAAAERGAFSTVSSWSAMEQASVLLWQSKEKPEQFSTALLNAQTLCPFLAPVVSHFQGKVPETLCQVEEKKQKIIDTIEALFVAQRHTEAVPLIQAMKQAYPQEHHVLFYTTQPSEDPVQAVKQALSQSLSQLDTPMGQVKKQFLEKRYSALIE